MGPTDRPGRVLCLRPEADFAALGVEVPAALDVQFAADERSIDGIEPDVRCLVLPSAGAALGAELFAGARGLTLVQYTGAGTDRIADEIVDELGCAVCNVPGASAKDVAAYVLLTSGALLRRIGAGDALVRSGRYAEARAALAPAHVRGFRGLRVGIVGFGAIGVETALAFDALGAEPRWYDPVAADRPEMQRFARSELDALLRWAEVLTVHVPLTPATRGLVGRSELALLPDGAVVVNAARGGIVDEVALVDALESGQLGGAALDVYESEPLPATSPLLDAASRLGTRLVLTPHIAGVTPEASRELFVRAWSNVLAVVGEAREPAHRVR